MINWPEIVFPPINLYSAPKFTSTYLDLESEYCNEEMVEFAAEPEHTLRKEYLRLLVKEKREEFNKLWNRRAVGG